MQNSVLERYLLGLSLYPLEFAFRQLVTTIAKKHDYVSETYYEYTARTFQTVDSPGIKALLPSENLAKRFLVEKIFLLMANQSMPIMEELLFRVLLQDYIMNTLVSAVGICEYQTHVGFRILLTALLFGMAHAWEAELNIKDPPTAHSADQYYKDDPESIRYAKNYNVLGAIVGGLIYGFSYEYAGFWGSYGSHMMWNFMNDALRSKVWTIEETNHNHVPDSHDAGRALKLN